jgi:hypothetical protein
MDENERERIRCMAMSRDRGDFVVGDDGYYVFWPEAGHGALAPHHLRWLADELDKMNADWHATVQNDPLFKEPK